MMITLLVVIHSQTKMVLANNWRRFSHTKKIFNNNITKTISNASDKLTPILNLIGMN